jgi:protein-S-isoprenylcysteine O-methyltransferase Ste14
VRSVLGELKRKKSYVLCQIILKVVLNLVELGEVGVLQYPLFLKNLVFFILLVVSVLVVVPLGLVWLANGFFGFSLGLLRFLGFVPVGVGLFFLLNMVVYFAVVGGGTPAPFDPPRKLVNQGLFRYVRNPGYIGGLLVILGEGLILESILVFVFAAFMFAMFHFFVIYYEEPKLKEMFRESYEEYFNTVPRWFPRFSKEKQESQLTEGTSRFI